MGYMYNDNSDTDEMYLSWNLLFFLKYTNNILLFCRTDFSDALVDSKILQSHLKRVWMTFKLLLKLKKWF